MARGRIRGMGVSGTKPKQAAAVPSNAFAGKQASPNEDELAAALGRAKEVWDEVVQELSRECGLSREWGSSSIKAGWSLRLKHKDRIIVYLAPNQGAFLVSLALGDKAVKVAQQSALPARIRKIIGEARRYAEGTGVRIPVQGPGDVAAIKQLARIKLEN